MEAGDRTGSAVGIEFPAEGFTFGAVGTGFGTAGTGFGTADWRSSFGSASVGFAP